MRSASTESIHHDVSHGVWPEPISTSTRTSSGGSWIASALHSKREAVDLALRELLGGVMTKEEALAMEGFGWNGDLNQIRGEMKIREWG